MKLVTTSPIAPQPEDWRRLAACQGDNGEAFYPPVGPEKRAAKRAREAQAKAVCAECAVRAHCLDQALRNGERYGIWGGLTDAERNHLIAS